MKVTVEPVQIILPPPIVARSTGVHVSGIIRAIASETGILKPEWVEEFSLVEVKPSTRFSDPVVALRVCMGLAWEEWYIPNMLAREGVIDHPGEYCVDGIYMSPDGEGLIDVSQVVVDRRYKPKVHEVKLTYKSINTVGETEGELESQFMWLSQIKAYCKGAGTDLADLHVLFVCGDYSWPQQPQKRRFHLEFEPWEIEQNWEMLLAYKEHKLRMEAE